MPSWCEGGLSVERWLPTHSDLEQVRRHVVQDRTAFELVTALATK